MNKLEKLKDILNNNKDMVNQLGIELDALMKDDVYKENASLKQEVEQLAKLYEEVKKEKEELKARNKRLKEELFEQIYNERTNKLISSKERLDAYFKANEENSENSLTSLELRLKQRINEVSLKIAGLQESARTIIMGDLSTIENKMNSYFIAARNERRESFEKTKEDENKLYEELREKQIDEDTFLKVKKKNNLEAFLGLNILNKVGIFLIIIGVITALQFSFTLLQPTLKSVLAFSFGAVLLVVGELVNRKKASVFSMGITSGAIAILYVSLSISFFVLHTLSMFPAIFLCILITITAFFLSQRYNSQTIASFALVGGYLPLLSIIKDVNLIYYAMLYFTVLNVFAFITAVHKRWNMMQYIGFFMNTFATIFITYAVYYELDALKAVFTVVYILLSFTVYNVLPLLRCIRNNERLQRSAIVLMGLNTVISSMVTYLAFSLFNYGAFMGALAIYFALFYVLSAWFVSKKLSVEKNVLALFYITGLAFAVFVIPLQFGLVWLSLGWLIEGTILLIYGVYYNEKNFKNSGFLICGLCILAFIFSDILFFGWLSDIFVYKYLAITVSALIVMFVMAVKEGIANYTNRVFKYAAILNMWLFVAYIIYEKLGYALLINIKLVYFQLEFLISMLFIIVTYLIAFSLPKIKLLYDKGVRVISLCMYAIGIIIQLGINFTPIVYEIAPPFMVTIIAGVVLIAINLLTVIAMKELLYKLVLEAKLSVELYPLLVSAFFVLIATQNLITQYNLQFTNIFISALYLVTSILWIFFGFAKRFALIRKFGLILSFLAITKLFLLDLSFLTQGGRIISYFAFGVVLIGISFIYQYFNKKIEEEKPRDEKTDS